VTIEWIEAVLKGVGDYIDKTAKHKGKSQPRWGSEIEADLKFQISNDLKSQISNFNLKFQISNVNVESEI